MGGGGGGGGEGEKEANELKGIICWQLPPM